MCVHACMCVCARERAQGHEAAPTQVPDYVKFPPQSHTHSKTGLQCAFVGEEQHDSEIKQSVLRGEYQLIYIRPESLLSVTVA